MSIKVKSLEDYKSIIGLSFDKQMEEDLKLTKKLGTIISKTLSDQSLEPKEKAEIVSKYTSSRESLIKKYSSDSQLIQLGALRLFQKITDKAVEKNDHQVISFFESLSEGGFIL